MRISDWSSDVCSSDLVALPPLDQGKLDAFAVENDLQVVNCPSVVSAAPQVKLGDDLGEAARYKSLVYGGAGGRSEERGVGKECVSTCRSRWWWDDEKKNKMIDTRRHR